MAEKKRVALFYSRLSSSGGAERMICWLANQLAKNDFDVLLLSLDETKSEPFYSLSQQVVWVPLGNISQVQRIKQQVLLLKKFNIQVLIAFVASGDRTIYLAGKLARARIIIAERNAPSMYSIRFSPVQRLMSFMLMHLADRITVQQQSFVDCYPKTLRSRFRCIPNPVEIPLAGSRPEKSNNDRFSILAVTRLDSAQKGVSYLIDAFAQNCIGFPNWDLTIVGKGPQYEVLCKMVRDYNLGQRVKFVGEMRDLSDYYLNSHLFVIPSLWEGFPNSLAEAMSYGLPSVGFSEAQGVSSLISADVGWLAKGIENSKSLAESMAIAMSYPEVRAIKGKAARAEIAKYTPDVQISSWIKVIEEV